MRKAPPRQLSLFAEPPSDEGRDDRVLDLDRVPGIDADRELAARLPSEVHLGTSTWTYPGWVGVVYPDSPRPTDRWLIDHGLRTFSRHPLFRTVGMDRAFYSPISVEEWRRYAEQLPDGFCCLTKGWGATTARVDHRSLAPNPLYLDAGVFCDRVLAPIAKVFRDHMGPIVLEFSPVPRSCLPTSSQFVDELHQFLDQLPREFRYAVELRNRELLTPGYLRLLRHHGVGHVLNLWERMPSIGEQLEMPNIFTAPFVVSRLMLRPGTRYEQMKREYAPFDRIVRVDESVRRDVTALASACVRSGRALYVISGNKVEGCGPLTARALAQSIVASRELAKFAPRKTHMPDPISALGVGTG